MIIEIPRAITSKQCSFIKEAVTPFLLHSEQNTYNRDGKTVNITHIPDLHEVDKFLSKLFARVQENVVKQRFRPPPECTSGDSGYEYHLYGTNEVCHYHSDGELADSKASKTLLRYASVILHLNTVHEGGELVFPEQNKSIKTEEGKLVIFPPYGIYGHYTTPSNETREILVTWFVYDSINIINTSIK
jgi:hypothetical protein